METMEMPMTQGVTQDVMEHVVVSDFEVEVEDNNTHEVTLPTIDSLLEEAASEGDGFEEILTKIADGEFEDEGAQDEVEVQEDEIELQDDEELGDEMITHEEFVILEEKVDTLIETTKEVSEKLDRLPQEMRMNAKEFYDMILAMYKLAKEEKSKKKRGSMFLFLIKLVGIFMQSIADPEALDKLEPKEQEEEEEQEEEGSVTKMMDYLQKNGMLRAA